MKTKLLGILGAAALSLATLGSASATVVSLGNLGVNDSADLSIPSLTASATPFDIFYTFTLSSARELTTSTFIGLPYGATTTDSHKGVQSFSFTLHDGPPSSGALIATGTDNSVPGQTNFTIGNTLLGAGSYYIEATGLYAPLYSAGPHPGSVDTFAKLSVAGGLTVSAVPEVSTWAMMFLGFAALGFAGFRSRRSVDLSA